MNSIHGLITDITTEDGLSFVRVGAYGYNLSAIIIDTPDTAPWLRTDQPVSLLFKETEVIIATNQPLSISVRNQLHCTIKKIQTGRILCQLDLLLLDNNTAAPAPDPVILRSVITRNACEQLDLKENDGILALIKTNEVSITAHD